MSRWAKQNIKNVTFTVDDAWWLAEEAARRRMTKRDMAKALVHWFRHGLEHERETLEEVMKETADEPKPE